MKCPHCSVPVARTDWFCANCKRSVAREELDFRDTRKDGRVRLVGMAAVGAVLSGLLMWRSTMTPQLPPPTATIEEVAPEIRIVDAPAPNAPRVSATAVSEVVVAPVKESIPGASAAVTDEQPEAEPPANEGTLTILVECKSPTFVYADGGKLLGQAPLREVALSAGEHQLLFWTPRIGARLTRRVVVETGKSLVVEQRVLPPEDPLKSLMSTAPP